tara:strand:+ start:84 stop:395 length:312 start_codon:yes stop_codon:yes gene_type:complete
MSTGITTYIGKTGELVYADPDYKEISAKHDAEMKSLMASNPLGITDEMLAADAANHEKDKNNEPHLKYLHDTDWYAMRKADTGVEIPSDIAAKRQAAREAIQS